VGKQTIKLIVTVIASKMVISRMVDAHLFKEARGEVTGLLRDLIRIDTTNPSGNETEAAQYLAKTLEKEGFVCELLESGPRRGNAITRIKGSGEKPSLLLLSHLDVVAANPREWNVEPFAGVVKDGFVWGRGALDMKSMTAIEVMIMKLLKRRHVKLKGDVILAATADEEKGGEQGVGWLTRKYPEKIRADYVINEGGGLAVPVNGKSMYTVQTAEKGILWFKVKAKGTPGHGSIPGAADNAIVRMNDVVRRLEGQRSKITLTQTVKRYLTEMAKERKTAQKVLKSLLQNPATADQVLDELAKKDKMLAEEIRAKLRMTVTPTMIRGGVKENIIPSECEAVFDCRVLLGQTTSEAMDKIKGLLRNIGLENLQFEIIQANEPSESPLHTALYREIVSVLREFDSDCVVAPDMVTGGTDSRFLRKMGAVCYGFQPMRADMPYGEIKKGIHGVDERISIDNLVFGTSVLYAVVKRFMT
jgi:acetylornithine deacetylase/succinyl-diaminopimelate desuccinylase-like protein